MLNINPATDQNGVEVEDNNLQNIDNEDLVNIKLFNTSLKLHKILQRLQIKSSDS